MFLHSVDLDEPEEKAEAKGLELSPRKSFKGIAIEMPPAEPQPQPAEEEEEDVNLDTIDLNGPSDEVEVAQVIRRVVSKESIDIDLASAEPETVVTPASPVHKPAPYEALSPTSSVSPISPVSEKPLPVPVQESSHLSPAASTPGTPGFADIPLTPAAVGGAPTSPGPTRMASLFTRVLDYGKQAQTTQTPPKAPVSEEKKLPETPTPSKQPAAGGKSFFTSFNLPSLPPIRAPTMSGMTMPTMPSMGGPSPEPTPPAESPTLSRDSANGMLGEPKPAASTWRATMTNFLASRTSSSNNVPVAPNSSSSTNLLLHRLDDPTSAHDRRISHEFGDTHKLREGFERVRGEMEGAARDIRREIARGEEQPEDGAAGEGIDWTFWGAVVQDYEGVAREQPKELSKAIQQGIPTVIRGPIWQLMSSSKSAELEETYKALLKLTSPHEKAIQKDISRTFPDHKTFKHTGAGQDGLFMVVKAFSLYDRDVGYTQGMAFIVATLLLHMPDEEAFGVLVRLMHSYNLRSHFLPDMPGLHLRLYQFDRLVEDVLPLLHQHLVRKGVKSDMYASQWFMTLFSYR
jgi:hypothetical protein